MKKEEKYSVGRPKLADTKLKKKSVIISCVCLVVALALLITGAFELNILKFNTRKLKGTVNTSLCGTDINIIPEELRYSETNPDGFKDIKFYSAVLSAGRTTYGGSPLYNSPEYCSTMTKEDLAKIRNLDVSDSGLTDVSGMRYLTSLNMLSLSNNQFASIDLSHNTSLRFLALTGANLSSIDISHNTSLTNLLLNSNNLSTIDVSKNILLNTLWVNNNNLNSIDLSKNTALEYLELAHNNLSSIDLSKNVVLRGVHLYDNNLSSIDLSQNSSLITLYSARNKLTSIDLSNNTKLTNLDLSSNNFNKTYTSIEDSIILDEPNVITAYPNDTIYSMTNLSIATYNNGIVKRVNPGFTILKVKYKVSESMSFEVNYNISFVGLSSSEYKIDYENKTIDVKNDIFNKSKIGINSNQYELRESGNKVEILNSEKEVVDSYEIINERKKIEDAYLKSGFKDKKLYTCVVRSYFEDENIEGNYLLTDEEMQNIESLVCINQNIKDTTGIEKLTNLTGLMLNYNDIKSINISNNTNLYFIALGNNKLTSLNVSKNTALAQIDVQNNEIEKIIGLDKLGSLSFLVAYNNNLSDLDISKTTALEGVIINNNPFVNTLYMLKETEIDYKKDFRLNELYGIKYNITDTGVVSYKDNKLKSLKEGITNIYLSNENMGSYKSDYYDKVMECDLLRDEKVCSEIENVNEEEILLPYIINQEIKVYDITSDVYKVDKEKKTIDVSGIDLDISKIKLTLEGLSTVVSGDSLIIKDKKTVVDTYKLLNMKKVENDTKNTTISKKIGNNTKSKTKKKETITEDLSDIEINGLFVSMLALQQVKGKGRNIVIKNKGITITINGKDIKKVNGNLNLSYELKVLKESIIYETLKDKIKNGIVLSFNIKELPYKMLIEIETTDKVEKEIGRKNINVYNYNNSKYDLVADDLSSHNNKITFYINKLGTYVLTADEINKKNVGIDSGMYKENTKLSKNISNRKLIISIIIFVILMIFGIIGYKTYMKNNNKNY